MINDVLKRNLQVIFCPSITNTSKDILDPLTLQVFVIGLNGWMITDVTAGSDTMPYAKEKPEFLMVCNVSRDKVALLLREVNPKFL